MTQPLSRLLADHVVSMPSAAIPPAAIHAARRSLLDGLGVMLAASGMAAETFPFADLAAASGGGSCTLLGGIGRASATEAAFANGALAHAMDFEDSFDIAPVHPNACLIPALLAFAEESGPVSGTDFLAAMAVGCDLVCRLGLALRTDPTAFGWYPPPILGGVGAVAACARVAGLSADQLIDAFSLLLCSSTCSAEIKYSPQSHIRAVRDAFPAEAAVRAVQLAARGVKGFDCPIEGKAGLFAMYARGEYDAAPLLERLGKKFHGEDLSFKPWPSCRGTHPFIGAVLALAEEHGFTAAQVARIDLEGHPILRMLSEPEASKCRPSTAIDAKFSLPFTVSAALLDGGVTLDSFSAAALGREDIALMAQRVHVTIDENAPANAIVAGITSLTLADGRTLTRAMPQALGHPTMPMSDADLAAKFRMCASRAARPLADDAADELIAVLAILEKHTDAARAITGAMESPA